MAIDCALTFSKKDEQQFIIGHVVNLSSKGILFTSTDKINEGMLLDIVLTPSNSITPPMEASVIVARVTDNNAVFEIACEINEIK